MFCTTCGHKLPSEELKFCPECGQPTQQPQSTNDEISESETIKKAEPVTENEPVIETEPTPKTEPEQQQVPQPQPTPRKPMSKGKKALTFFVFLLFIGLGGLYIYLAQLFDVDKQKQAFLDAIHEPNYNMYQYIDLPDDVIYQKDGYINIIQDDLNDIDDLEKMVMKSKDHKIPLEDGDLFYGTLVLEPHWMLFKKLVFEPNIATVHLTSEDDDLILHFSNKDVELKKGKKTTFKTLATQDDPLKVTHKDGLIKEGILNPYIDFSEPNEVFEDTITASDFTVNIETNNIDATLYYDDTSLGKTIRDLDSKLVHYSETTEPLKELTARVHVNGKTYTAKNEANFGYLFQFEDAAAGESNIKPSVSKDELQEFLSSFRDDYEHALNFDDAPLISKYFVEGSKIQRNYKQFVRDMHPSSYYDFMQFDVTDVETVSPTSFIVSTYEVFDFTEHTGHTIHYKRQKEYDVIVKDDELFITDIRIPETKKNLR